MNISVGVLAYNEEQNIERLLDTLMRQTVPLKEVFVVSSGSTDKTNDIVRRFANKKVRLIVQEKRLGKASAINEFLRRASSKIVVVASADIMLEEDTISELCKPFRKEGIGIVASHPVPEPTRNMILEGIIQMQWRLHHELSLQNPKFGELIAFRNVVRSIHNTSVDEECLAKEIRALGFEGCYAARAIVHNKGPETVRDFLKQRRRIFCGHLELRKLHGYSAASMNTRHIAKALGTTLRWRDIPQAIAAGLLESTGRMLGAWDYYHKRDKHYIWDIAKTTKDASYNNPSNI
jgi:cellulose synthase/poly-beta-1,6-N-acetylglucosamine synthase-like glycosyltransferase